VVKVKALQRIMSVIGAMCVIGAAFAGSIPLLERAEATPTKNIMSYSVFVTATTIVAANGGTMASTSFTIPSWHDWTVTAGESVFEVTGAYHIQSGTGGAMEELRFNINGAGISGCTWRVGEATEVQFASIHFFCKAASRLTPGSHAVSITRTLGAATIDGGFYSIRLHQTEVVDYDVPAQLTQIANAIDAVKDDTEEILDALGGLADLTAFQAHLDSRFDILEAEIAAMNATVVASVADAVTTLLDESETRWLDWLAEFNLFDQSVSLLVSSEGTATRQFVHEKYNDTVAYLDALDTALRTFIEVQHDETRNDIAAFRIHYNNRQDAWEVAFDAEALVIKQLITSEHNGTRALINTAYANRTLYLDAAFSVLDVAIDTGFTATAGAIAAAQSAILNDAEARWNDWEIEFGLFDQSIHLKVEDEADATRVAMALRFDAVDAYLSGMNATLREFVLAQHETTRALITAPEFQTALDALEMSLKSFVSDKHNETRAVIQARYDDRTTYLDAMTALLVSAIAAEHNTTRQVVNLARDAVLSKIDVKWGEWSVLFDEFEGTLSELVISQNEATRVKIDVAYVNRTAHLDALSAAIIAVIEAEHELTRGEVTAFREHFDDEWAAWTVTFDNEIQTVVAEVVAQGASTRALIDTAYENRTVYLNALRDHLEGIIAAGNLTVHAALDAAVAVILDDHEAGWATWMLDFEEFRNSIHALVEDEAGTTRALVNTAYGNRTAYLEAMKTALMALVASEHETTRAEVASFRAHYDESELVWLGKFYDETLEIYLAIDDAVWYVNTFAQTKYNDRTTYLNAMTNTITTLIAAEHSNTRLAVTDARDMVLGAIDEKWVEWEVTFDGFNRTIMDHINATADVIQATIVTKYDERTAYLDGLNQTLREHITDEAVATRAGVTSFRALYENRQDTWEATFTAETLTTRQLITDEAGEVRALVEAQYADRTEYLDAMEATLTALIQAEHNATRNLVASSREAILADVDVRWTAWNVTFSAATLAIQTQIEDEHEATRLHVTQQFAAHRDYEEMKWEAWFDIFDDFQADQNTSVQALHAEVTASFAETWNRLDIRTADAQAKHLALVTEIRTFWQDYNVTASADTQAIRDDIAAHGVVVDGLFADLEALMGSEHDTTRAVVQAHHEEWEENHDAWLAHFSAYWLHYNETEAVTLGALLSGFASLEAANQARYSALRALILAAWADLSGNISRVENRLISFEDRLNVTLAEHFAAVLTVEAAIQDSLVAQKGLIQALWGNLNVTLEGAAADRQEKYESVLSNLASEISGLESRLDDHAAVLLDAVTSSRDQVIGTVEAHHAEIAALLEEARDEIRMDFAGLGALLREDGNRTRDLLKGFWADSNQTWAAWYSHFNSTNMTAEIPADDMAVLIAHHELTRSNMTLRFEEYFVKSSLVVQSFSQGIIGGLGEEILTNREHIDSGRQTGLSSIVWVSLLVEMAKYLALGIILLLLTSLVTNHRVRRIIKAVNPWTTLRAVRDASMRVAMVKRARRNRTPSHQAREDRAGGPSPGDRQGVGA
jgi:hypothetical protein